MALSLNYICVFRDNKMTAAYLSHTVDWKSFGGWGLEEIMCHYIPQTTSVFVMNSQNSVLNYNSCHIHSNCCLFAVFKGFLTGGDVTKES